MSKNLIAVIIVISVLLSGWFGIMVYGVFYLQSQTQEFANSFIRGNQFRALRWNMTFADLPDEFQDNLARHKIYDDGSVMYFIAAEIYLDGYYAMPSVKFHDDRLVSKGFCIILANDLTFGQAQTVFEYWAKLLRFRYESEISRSTKDGVLQAAYSSGDTQALLFLQKKEYGYVLACSIEFLDFYQNLPNKGKFTVVSETPLNSDGQLVGATHIRRRQGVLNP